MSFDVSELDEICLSVLVLVLDYNDSKLKFVQKKNFQNSWLVHYKRRGKQSNTIQTLWISHLFPFYRTFLCQIFFFKKIKTLLASIFSANSMYLRLFKPAFPNMSSLILIRFVNSVSWRFITSVCSLMFNGWESGCEYHGHPLSVLDLNYFYNSHVYCIKKILEFFYRTFKYNKTLCGACVTLKL